MAWNSALLSLVLLASIQAAPPSWSRAWHKASPVWASFRPNPIIRTSVGSKSWSWVIRQLRPRNPLTDGKLPPTAEYLPSLRETQPKKQRANFQQWFNTFEKEQQAWCGVPETPIRFNSKEKESFTFKDAKTKSWPWMVSLYGMPSYIGMLFQELGIEITEEMTDDFPGLLDVVAEHKCGGTLISSEFVLTAAHCVHYRQMDKQVIVSFEDMLRERYLEICNQTNRLQSCVKKLDDFKDSLNGMPYNGTKYWQLWVGAHVVNPYSDYPSENSEKLKVVKVKKVIHYPGSDTIVGLAGKGFHEDLALLQLETPIKTFSDTIRPICLTSKYASNRMSKDTKECAVAGWGAESDKNGLAKQLTNALQAAPYSILSDKTCKKSGSQYSSFKAAVKIRFNTKEQICAVERNHKEEKVNGRKTKLCYGDSGGPLICKYKDNRWYQIGLLSYGESEPPYTCELGDSPDVFIKVPSFTDWIVQTMYEVSVYKPSKVLSLFG